MAKVTLFVVDEDEAIAESVIDVSNTIPTLPPVELLFLLSLDLSLTTS